ncbi:hypothetical protein C8R45DRAFT_411337 [Mycena sanguinolenta]|nr:hypothetical protein C8R45DRAFT_411337 [Mycena sanguinolenta]
MQRLLASIFDPMALQKHLMKDPDTLVVDSLTGLCAVNQLSFEPPNKGFCESAHLETVCISDAVQVVFKWRGDAQSCVQPIQSLPAAVCGNVFASLNSSQVRWGIDLVEDGLSTTPERNASTACSGSSSIALCSIHGDN